MDEYFNPTTGEFVLYAIHQVRYFPNGNTTRHEGGIFMSTNNGNSWTNINGNVTIDINQLIDFAIEKNYFQYIARWFGITEQQARTRHPVVPTNVLQYFNMIESDPSNRNTVYVAHHDPQIRQSIAPGRLWKTTNRGQNWTNVARDNGTGDAWTRDFGYWQSRNNPSTDNMVEGHQISSQQFGRSYPLRATRSFAVNNRGDIMLLYAHNTFLSTNGGTTWEQVNEERISDNADGITIIGTGDSNLPGAAIHQDKRLGNGIVYLGSGEHHLWRTSNAADPRGLGRQAVTYINGTQESAASVVTHPFDENIVFTTSERQSNLDRVFRSADGGRTWEDWGRANDAEQQIRTNNLIIDPIDPNNIYYGASITEGADNNKQPGVFVSTDGGRTFGRRNSGLPNFPQIEDVIFDPRDNTRASLFTAVQYNFSRSRAGLSGNHEGGLFHSTNRGLTWTRVNIPNQIEGVNRVIFDHSNRMYIATGARERPIQNGGVFYSDNFGQTWTRVFEAQYVEHIDISSFDHNRIICSFGSVTRNPGFYLSEDRGQTWTKENNGNGAPNLIRHVEFSEDNEEVIYTAIAGSGYSKGAYPGGANSRRVIMSPSTASINIGQRLQLNPTTAFGVNRNNLIYRSSNEDVATVSTNGLVTGIKQGAVEVIATSPNGRFSDYVYLVVSSGSTSPGSGIAIPGRVEAENFSNQFGVQTEPSQNEGPGAQNIGFIQNGDFAEYEINVIEAGTYTFNFRVATATSGGNISIVANGASVGSVSVGNTQGFQSWQNVSTSVNLSSGLQILRLNFNGGGGFLFNVNFIDVTRSTSPKNINENESLSKITIWPNPFVDSVNIQVNSSENVTVDIYNINGQLIYSQKTFLESELEIDLSSYSSGLYFIKLDINDKVFRVIKK